MPDETALARWARERPDAPFVFYRGRRGQFGWHAYAAAAKLTHAVHSPDAWLPAEAEELLRFASRVPAALPFPPGPPGNSRASVLDAPAEGRDVWISWRSLAIAEESALAAWATRSGAAVLVERHERFPVELYAWARPTLISGPVAELVALLDEVERLAPNWLRERWLRQRLRRLRLVLIEGTVPSEAVSEIEVRLRRLDAGCPARVLPFPAGLATPLV